MKFLLLMSVAAAELFLFLDFLQTLQISIYPNRWRETGWARFFIGEHPHPFSVATYFTVCGFLTLIVPMALAHYWSAWGAVIGALCGAIPALIVAGIEGF